MLKRFVLLSLCAGAIACGAAASSSETAVQPEARRDRNVIQAEEMNQVQALNLYEVVQRVHPEWLKVRSTLTTGQRAAGTTGSDLDVQVYIDQQRAGTSEILKSMPIRGAASMRYYSASEAQVKFGSGNLSGAIQVLISTK